MVLCRSKGVRCLPSWIWRRFIVLPVELSTKTCIPPILGPSWIPGWPKNPNKSVRPSPWEVPGLRGVPEVSCVAGTLKTPPWSSRDLALTSLSTLFAKFDAKWLVPSEVNAPAAVLWCSLTRAPSSKWRLAECAALASALNPPSQSTRGQAALGGRGEARFVLQALGPGPQRHARGRRHHAVVAFQY